MQNVGESGGQRKLWRDDVFIDEEAERLLVGQLLVHPDRFRELPVAATDFNSSRATLFRIMRDHVCRHGAFDLVAIAPALRAAGLTCLALSCAEEWWDEPRGVRELGRRLRARRRRRVVDLVGENLLYAARDPALGDDEFMDRVRDATGTLLNVLEKVSAMTGLPG